MLALLKYLKGIYLAMLNKYPYDELEHLKFIKVNITTDHQWLCQSNVNSLLDRHLDYVQDNWKSIPIKDISNYRHDLMVNQPELFNKESSTIGKDHNAKR